ncbi:hypothetical protein PO909_023534 [Leuciscus waleckii]
MARRNDPYSVHELEHKDFLDFKSLSNHILKNRTKDEEGQSVHWQKIKWFRYTKDEPKTIFFKYDFTAPTFRKLTVAQQATRGTRGTRTTHPSSLYENPPVIRALKKKDLLTMCTNGSIPHCYAEFYNTLTVGSVVPPALNGPSNVEQTFEEIQFQNVTQGSLARAIKQNDWFTSVDLKDAFFHISIYPPHRKYLRLAYQGIPFGRNLSPRTFCLCVEAGVAPLRLSGLRILNYIYDWFIIAKSKEKVSLDTGRVLAHITSLGFKVNASKNNLTPSQNVFFLGLELNSVSLRARLSQERVRSLMNCLSQFREGARVQYRTCLRLQGLMASSIQVVPLGLLRMRAFTKWVLSLHFSPIRDLCRLVTVTRACSAALRHWESENFTLGEPPWDGYDAESCDDRCVLNRLGNHPGRQNGERSVAEQTTFSAH